MGNTISAINEDYELYTAVCQHIGEKTLPLYSHPNEESFYEHLSRLQKAYKCDTPRQILRLPEGAKPVLEVTARERIAQLERAMRQLRADATKGQPMCVNLGHIDRLWATVGITFA